MASLLGVPTSLRLGTKDYILFPDWVVAGQLLNLR